LAYREEDKSEIKECPVCRGRKSTIVGKERQTYPYCKGEGTVKKRYA